MNGAMPNSNAFTVLRTMFDLLQVDVRPSRDLLGRLTGHETEDVSALLAQLRRAGLVQMDRLGLTMAGLAIATRLPETEPVRSAAVVEPVRRCHAA
jgi:hypothetical protein